MALVPTTDELLDDANALTSYLPQKVALSIRWKANESILFGAGNGILVGCMNAGAIVTVATVVKESGQATQTLVPQNLAKMIARLPPGSFTNAVWIINNDVLPALFTLSQGNFPIYLPQASRLAASRSRPTAPCLGAGCLFRSTRTEGVGTGLTLTKSVLHQRTSSIGISKLGHRMRNG